MHNNMEYMLLHGWGASNSIWQEFAGSLSNHKNIKMPCMYETALMSKNNKFASMAAVLNESLNPDTIIIAWSIGGLVATSLAALTNKIKAIVFIASAPCFVNKKDWSCVIDPIAINDLQKKLLKDSIGALEYFAGLIAYGDVSMKETNKMIRSNLADEKYTEILSSWLSQMKDTDQRKEFSELDLPIQFILGENDSLVNSKIEIATKLLNPKITSKVVNNSGHAPFISKKNETLKIINEFVYAKLNK